MPGMIPALAAEPFHGPAQDGGHHLAALFGRIHLPCHHGAQAAVLCAHVDGVDHPLVHHICIKGADDVICRTQKQGPVHRALGILRRDHDHRDIVQQFPLVHGFQHLKPIHAGHVDVQQHNGNTGGVPLQQAHAFLAAARLGRVELVSQHLAQDHAVYARIVHDQRALAAVRQHGGRLLGLLLDHRPVLLDACIVHQLFRTLYPVVQIRIFHPDAADACRHAQVGAPWHAGRVELQTDLLQLLAEVLLPDVRQKQQKHIAVKADDAVLFFQAAADDIDRRFQHGFSGAAAVDIRGKHHIIQIQHDDARRHGTAVVVFIIVLAVVRAGALVAVGALPLAGNGSDEPFAVVRAQQQAAVHLLGKFQHAGLSVHLDVAGRHLIQVPAHIFQLAFAAFFQQYALGHAVFARAVPLPVRIAGPAALPALHILRRDQPHRAEHLAQLTHFFFDLFPGRSLFLCHFFSPVFRCGIFPIMIPFSFYLRQSLRLLARARPPGPHFYKIHVVCMFFVLLFQMRRPAVQKDAKYGVFRTRPCGKIRT